MITPGIILTGLIESPLFNALSVRLVWKIPSSNRRAQRQDCRGLHRIGRISEEKEREGGRSLRFMYRIGNCNANTAQGECLQLVTWFAEGGGGGGRNGLPLLSAFFPFSSLLPPKYLHHRRRPRKRTAKCDHVTRSRRQSVSLSEEV